jgi:pimeloyl-ACP methyl ester carboxylesterase
MEATTQYQGKNLFYRVTGNGKPVMLIHGFGEDGTIWNNQVEALKNKYRFIVPDLPGSGKSEMIDDMSIEGLAEAIRDVITKETQNLPSGPIPVVGHSMGGYITLALVEKYPELVSSFGLFHSSAYADSEEKKATRRKGIEFINQHGAFEFLKTAIPNLFSPDSRTQIPGSIEKLIAAGNNFKPEALVSYYEAMMARPDRTSVLSKTAVPVLFIMGKYDVAVPVEDSLEQSHLPAKSYIHVLQQTGHMGMLEEPEKSCGFLDEFLSNN